MDLPVDDLARPEYQQLNSRQTNQQLLNSEAGSPADMDSTSIKSPGECQQSKKFNRNAAVLIEWIDEHPFNPYPTKTEKAMLAEKAGMSIRQLNDWFANARRNIKKYSYETWKKRKSGESLNKIYNDNGQKAPPNTTIGKMRNKLLVRSSSSIPGSAQFPPKFSCYETMTTECISGSIPYGNTLVDKNLPPLLGGAPKPIPIPAPVIVSQSAPYSHLPPPFLSPTTTATSWLAGPQTRFTPPPLIRPSVWPCSCSTCRANMNGSGAPQLQPMGIAPTLPLTAIPWTQMSPPSHIPVSYYDGLPNPEMPPPVPELLASNLSPPTINGKDVLGDYNKDWSGPPSLEP